MQTADSYVYAPNTILSMADKEVDLDMPIAVFDALNENVLLFQSVSTSQSLIHKRSAWC